MTAGPGKKILVIAVAAVALSTPAAAYYHFTHYTRGSAPWLPIPEKFDVNALPNKTLTFYVSDNGPTLLVANDSFASLLGTFRQAIQAWNSVGTSDLTLAFGGLYPQGSVSNTPNVQIIFSDDIPPGIIDMGGPISPKGPSNGQFVPILQSLILIPRNLSQAGVISSSEAYFTTVVHEIGHALGLQHTWTSSTMSTSPTRATSRARPIDADDIAGLTLLYPKPGALSQFGSITGRVLSNGQPVHLASVVAVRPTGAAVSTLTQPDGTWRIDGVPPDAQGYWVYVHPLPPAVQAGLGPGDIVLPLDPGGGSHSASGATETVFYPGTRDPNNFTQFPVAAGAVANAGDINVQGRPAPAIYDVTTFSYLGPAQVPVKSAYINSTVPATSAAATGTGLISGSSLAPGLGVQVLGGFGSITPQAYTAAGATNLALYVYPMFGTFGPRHLLFTLPNDAYVLPNGINLAQKQPPSISSVSPLADGSVAVTGSFFAADSRVYFDSLPAATRSFTGNDASSVLTVVPPVGFSNQVASVTVFNSDGQNSTFIQPAQPSFSYGFSPQPSFTAAPPTNALPIGVSAALDITGTNTQFADGQTMVGVSSSDITVRGVYVLSPTHLWANLVVAATAAPGSYTATIITGFQSIEVPFTLQVTGGPLAAINRPAIALPLVPSQGGFYPGSAVTLSGSNLSLPAAGAGSGATVSIAGQAATIVTASPTQISFVIPAGLQPGPALLNLNNGASDAFPVVIHIDAPPPVITSVLSSANQTVDASHPDFAGDVIQVMLQNLDPATLTNPSRLHLSENGVDLQTLSVSAAPGQQALYVATFALSSTLTSQLVQLAVTENGMTSNAVIIAIR
jgi:uncharacterized protein (TIGR03437 family)